MAIFNNLIKWPAEGPSPRPSLSLRRKPVPSTHENQTVATHHHIRITCTQKTLYLWLVQQQGRLVKLLTPSPFGSSLSYSTQYHYHPHQNNLEKNWRFTICRREDRLAATTPPLPVYHLVDHNQTHECWNDEDDDYVDDHEDYDDEPGKGGRQCELIPNRNSLDP